jgi:26S proteasome regulatory subunit N5
MAEETRKQTADYSEEVSAVLPVLRERVLRDTSTLSVVLEELLTLEKKTRLAADANSTKTVALGVLELLLGLGQWDSFGEHVVLLASRRAQMKPVVQAVVKFGFDAVDKTSDDQTREKLIKTLREVSDGKIFVELERSRLTKMLASMKERQGLVAEASTILQEVQVETVGSMDKREKAELLLEQLRLCLACSDFARAELVANKVSRKVLNEEDFQVLYYWKYALLARNSKSSSLLCWCSIIFIRESTWRSASAIQSCTTLLWSKMMRHSGRL